MITIPPVNRIGNSGANDRIKIRKRIYRPVTYVDISDDIIREFEAVTYMSAKLSKNQ